MKLLLKCSNDLESLRYPTLKVLSFGRSRSELPYRILYHLGGPLQNCTHAFGFYLNAALVTRRHDSGDQ